MFEFVINLLPTLFKTRLTTQKPSHLTSWRLTGLLFAVLVSSSATASAGAASAPDATKHMAAKYGQVPLSFEPNKGQTDPSVRFLSRGSGYSLFLTKDEVVLNLERQNAGVTTTGQKPASVDSLHMKLLGASDASAITGLEPQSGVVNYLIGNDQKKWHTGIETFGKVNFAQVYPGVDLVFYGNQRQLEYDFVVAPGADASRIAWQIDGAKPSIDAGGNLILSATNGPAGFKKPVLYQMADGKKVAVEGAFTVAGNRIGFQLGSYDHNRPLIIDPVLTYATYLGGSTSDTIGSLPNYAGSGNPYTGTAVTQGIAVDSEGSAYVTGATTSTDFPTSAAYQSTNNALSGQPSVFVTKFSSDGSSLVYSTYVGGSVVNNGMAIAVDSVGSAYVTGWTNSPDFPTTSGAYQTLCGPRANGSNNYQEDSSCGSGGTMSPFIFKLNAAGSSLAYSTFLGGYGNALGESIAVDATGRAYVVGESEAACEWAPGHKSYYSYTCFPTTSGAVISGSQIVTGADFDAFISVLDPTGANLLYSSLFGDTVFDCHNTSISCYHIADTFGIGVAVDPTGNFYLAGETNGMELPTTSGVIQPTAGPVNSANEQATIAGTRGFVAKFKPVTTEGGSSLAYATYLGGKTAGVYDAITSVTADANGNAYVLGTTASADFPVTSGAYQTSCYLNPNLSTPVCRMDAAFVAKLNATGTILDWSTYLGEINNNGDYVTLTGPIQLDGNGNVYVTGQAAGNFPWVGNMEPYTGGPVFVSELDPTGSKLLFSTEFGSGGGSTMQPGGLAVDPAGNMYVAMSNPCVGAIVTPGSFQQTDHNTTACAEYSTTGFVAKISATGTATVALTASPSPVAAGQSVTLTATVTPTATYASVPTGTIEFQDGGSELGTAVTLDATGKATYTSSTLVPGTHNLTAAYSGDSTYPTGNGTQTLVVNGLTASVKVTPSPASITTAMSLSVTVAVTGSGATPTGTVTLSGGGYNSPATTLTSGSATVTIPANSLSAGSDTLTVSYSGDANYNPANGTGSVTVTTPATPVITVTPVSNSINVTASLSVTVTVGGSGGVTPTGTVILSGGGYISAATALVNGSATIVIPANSLAVGNDTLTGKYSGDSNYAPASGTTLSTSPVTVTPAPVAPTVAMTPGFTTANTGATLSVPVTLTGGGAIPTGTVTLSGGGYTSPAETLVNGAYTFTIPSNSLSAGSDILTVKYSGDAVYLAGSATITVAVAQSAYSLAATTPAAVAAGTSASSTVTISTTTSYSGAIDLSCVLTNSPTGATNLPTCAAATPSVTLASGATSAKSTVTVTSVAATTAMASPVDDGKQNGWMRIGGGAVLALLFFLGVPSRRRGWSAMLGAVLLIVAIGTLSGCGGKSSSKSGNAGTTAGSYTFTVTGTGTPAETPAPTTTFTLTIN